MNYETITVKMPVGTTARIAAIQEQSSLTKETIFFVGLAAVGEKYLPQPRKAGLPKRARLSNPS